MPTLNDAAAVQFGDTEAERVYYGDELVWESGASAPVAGVAGYQTIGATALTASGDYILASRFPSTAGQVTGLRVYGDGNGLSTVTQPVRGVIYADSGGNPGARLAVSDEVSIVSGRGAGWVDFPLPAPITIPDGFVWLGIHAGIPGAVGPFRGRGDTGGLVRRYKVTAYTSGAPNPWGTLGDVSGTNNYSIYVVGP